MATTSYPVGHPLAVKKWSAEVFKAALKETYFSRFASAGSGSLCQIQSDLGKGPGDNVRVHLRMQLSGGGVSGDSTQEGNEEQLAIYSDDVYIDQLRHAVRSGGKMSEQRVPFTVRDEARDGLADWWADRLDYGFFNQLTGSSEETDTKYTGMQAAVAPTTGYTKLAGDSAATASLGATDIFAISLIDACVEAAMTLATPIRPLSVGAKDQYVLFLHPYQMTDLRRAAGTGEWLDIQKAVLQGGQSPDSNPIITGSEGMYHSTIIHESTRIPTRVSTVYRAVFCGAQAAAVAFGKKSGVNQMSWVEKLFDYDNQLGVSCGMIWGIKKLQFNSLDFGTIAVSTYAAAH